MSGYVLKPKDQTVTYVMDWVRGYLAPRESVTGDLGWSIHSTADEDPPLTIVEQAHDAKSSWAEFSGGAPGRIYMISNRVRTNDDRILSRAIVMRIALGATPAVRSSE